MSKGKWFVRYVGFGLCGRDLRIGDRVQYNIIGRKGQWLGCEFATVVKFTKERVWIFGDGGSRCVKARNLNLFIDGEYPGKVSEKETRRV